MPTAPISTNPLDASLDKIMGTNNPKKETDPLSPISYEDETDFRPGSDTITVSGTPATGATTAEEWTHEVQLEELRQQALEQEYQERAAAEAAAFEAQQAALEEANRQAQLGLSQSAEQRAWEQYGLTSAQTQQQMALDLAAEQRAADEMYMKYGGGTPADLERQKQLMGDYQTAMGTQNYSKNYATDKYWGELISQPNYYGGGSYVGGTTQKEPTVFKGYSYGGYVPASQVTTNYQYGPGVRDPKTGLVQKGSEGGYVGFRPLQ